MTMLQKPLEERGFEVAVFHATGMGGMAFEALSHKGILPLCDLALPELGNLMVGSVVNARQRQADGMPGRKASRKSYHRACTDLIDFCGLAEYPRAYTDEPFHEHNRLIKSSGLAPDGGMKLIKDISARLDTAKEGPVHFRASIQGVEEWDQEGEPAYDSDGLAAMVDEVRHSINVPLTEVDAHINDQAYADAVIAILDGWIADGTVV